MPRCDCRFALMKARLRGRRVLSYALIPERNYRATIHREYATVEEREPARKLRLIAEGAPAIGRLSRCPDCGAWLLAPPLAERRHRPAVLREVRAGTPQPKPRTGPRRMPPAPSPTPARPARGADRRAQPRAPGAPDPAGP